MSHSLERLFATVFAVMPVFGACVIFMLIWSGIKRGWRWLAKNYRYSPMESVRLNLIGTAILFAGSIYYQNIGLPMAILLWVVGATLYIFSNLERRV